MSWPLGSTWAKWDLHVHTPASLTHNYPGPPDDAWEAFLNDLEALPPEFRVLGINDYLFLDGYRRLVAERAKGRIQNIEAMFPVVELRLDKFGGSDSHFRRVNVHVIFSNELDPIVIEQQFINALASKYQLAPLYAATAVQWDMSLTRESLESLGRDIKATVPEEQLKHYGPDLIEGFNNLTLSLDQIRELIEKPHFEGRALLAVGKAEWSAMEWNDHSIADKKTVINSASIVFTASDSSETFLHGRDALEASGVNSHLLDCSDAHSLSVSSQKDRIGNCLTWIDAVPTFNGLRRALDEYDARVYVGDGVPPLIERVRRDPTRFIKSIRVSRRPEVESSHDWFDTRLDLNPGFSVIYGGKGQGKSALADIIALAGSSSREPYFSFLTPERFRDPHDNKAQSFEATVQWESGHETVRNLASSIPPGSSELVQYIPQNFLEAVCNEVQGEELGLFDAELNRVVFLHVPEAERLGEESLEDLIQARSAAILERASDLREALSALNRRIADHEGRQRPEVRTTLQTALEEKTRALAALDADKPTVLPSPDGDPDQAAAREVTLRALEEVRRRRDEQSAAAASTQLFLAGELKREVAADRLTQRLRNLEASVQQFERETAEDIQTLELLPSDILEFKTRPEAIAAKRTEIVEGRIAAQGRLDPNDPTSVTSGIAAANTEIQRLTHLLDEPSRRHQASLVAFQEWQQRREALVGDASTPDTISGLESAIKALDETPSTLEELRKQRLEITREIHSVLRQVTDVYRTIYRPVEEFISVRPEIRDAMGLNFDVSITVLSFTETFLNHINQAVLGSFIGREEGQRTVESLLESIDPNSVDEILSFVEQTDDRLRHDRREGRNTDIFTADQLRRGVTPEQVYDYVFGLSYLHPRFVLQSRVRPLDRLSPGEKGTLLLLFYLVIDSRDIPLILDQPEENLDNETVYELLVWALKLAKARRQLIVVTHNPNLAVVGDADQFINARFDGSHFEYSSGGLEEVATNEYVVKVLEGTRPAFDNRSRKYQRR